MTSVENPIYVSGDTNSLFNNTDYILFYGSGPIKWNLSTADHLFYHQQNYYSDATYYFITADTSSALAKRITQQASLTTAANKSITTFNDHLYHEKDSINLILSGKEWYGENFDILTSYGFSFTFPNINTSSRVHVKTNIASRGTNFCNYNINVNGNILNIGFPASYSEYVYASEGYDTMSFFSSTATVNVNITKSSSDAVGWLNYIDVNAMRNLDLSGSQLQFRSVASIGAGNISEFTVANAGGNSQIWEVTNPVNVKQQMFTNSGNTAVFRVATDSLREFIAFDGTNYKTPIMVGTYGWTCQ